MSSVQEPHLHLEVGHILFLDIVGYSKLLADEQKELVQELNQIVRETEQFRAAEAPVADVNDQSNLLGGWN
jgi:hypothetical protein